MEEYGAESIKVLEGLEGVRRRPAMYIGDTAKRGLHHLIFEIVDNAIDEALAGFCKNIEVVLKADGSASVRDDGRGIPTETHSKTGKSALELVSTVLHAGGKFEKKAYQVSGGLHGVGLSVVNALSEQMEIEVHRNGKIHLQKYARGLPQTKVEELGSTDYRGTIVRFRPDMTIFTGEFEFDYLRERLRELAFLNSGVRILMKDERVNREEEFKYDGGLAEFVKYLNRSREMVHEPFSYKRKESDVEVEYAIQYTQSYIPLIHTFANDIATVEGGTHLVGFKGAVTRAVNEYIKEHKILKGEEAISGEDSIEGLTAVVSVKVQEPQFEGQTKTKLGNSEVKGIVGSIAYESFSRFLAENPSDARGIMEKVIKSMRAREAAQKAKELIRRKGVFDGSVLPGKLADCIEKDPAKAEMFIVEGDSAGGCFSGDTKVALADGRNLTFRELVEEHRQGKQNFCYTIREDGRIGIAPIQHPRVTRKNARVIKVILDNGEELVCTPDHLFMLRDGSYRKAKDLAGTDSLMPLYRQHSKLGKRITIEGYELVFDPKDSRWIFTHLLADEYNIAKGKYAKMKNSCVHHMDFDKLNNNPTNLRRMGRQEHLDFHASVVKETMARPDVLEKIRKAHQSEEYRRKISAVMSSPKMSKMLSERAKTQWGSKDYKEYMAERFLEFYHNSPEYREKNNSMLNQSQKEYWASPENRKKQAGRVKKYFGEHPEKRKEFSGMAKKQWQDANLLGWRSKKTREQWTPEFRARRKAAYNATYKEKALALMKEILERCGELDEEKYNEERLKRNDKSLLRYGTIRQRFFENDESRLKETVANYNHKIVKLVELEDEMDVYDLEVEGTHNFALASGVFVHNSSKQGRDRRFQAILPLKGKILNVEKSPIHKILQNEEIRILITALGTGFGEDFNVAKLRYGKIVIMTDADVDGSHIRTLLLTLFYRYLKPVIEQGHMYIAQPPLFGVRRGKGMRYAFNELDLPKVVQEMGEGASVQRYKGLGEMNPEQLWETTLNPETRSMKRVTIEDAMLADEMFTILMGEAVEPRRKFIEENAKYVKNLDV
jgi:DNA gyrase subunit B